MNGCFSFVWAIVLLIAGSIAEAIASRKATVLVILVSLLLVNPALAQEPPYLPDPIATSGMWSEVQCDWVYYASLKHPFDDTRAVVLDVELLMTMQYEVGVWLGYDAAAPFGGHTFYQNDMVAIIQLVTPCGSKTTQVYQNRDSDTYTVIVYIDLIPTYAGTNEVCVYQGEPNPRRCGLHHGIFGFITAAEWQRVSGEPIISRRRQG